MCWNWSAKRGVKVIRHTTLKITKQSLIHFPIAVVSECLNTLSALLKTVPTFWGIADVKLLIDLYINGEILLSEQYLPQLERIVKIFAKQVPSKTLLSSVMQCWPSLEGLSNPVCVVSSTSPLLSNLFQTGVAVFGRFFDLLKRCLHSTPRPDISGNVKSLFTSFLVSFDARGHMEALDASPVSKWIIVVKHGQNNQWILAGRQAYIFLWWASRQAQWNIVLSVVQKALRLGVQRWIK